MQAAVNALPALPVITEEIEEAELTDQPNMIIYNPAAPKVSPVVLTLPLIDGTEFTVMQEEIDKWQEAYPAADVL